MIWLTISQSAPHASTLPTLTTQGGGSERGMALRHILIRRKPVLALAPLWAGPRRRRPPEDWEQINLTNNSLAAARPAELMAEEVTKWIKVSKETVTLCYRNRLNRFMLLPPRVGKVLRANSQALALAREVKALGAARRGRTQTQWQRERERGEQKEREILLFLSIHVLPGVLFSLVFNAS